MNLVMKGLTYTFELVVSGLYRNQFVSRIQAFPESIASYNHPYWHWGPFAVLSSEFQTRDDEERDLSLRR